ncbi:DUF3995 domain-containing protein [Streptomyces sp. ISL-96]|nr:DUF3995 domain-containing protein [Streptomyces sp. ISL-96]
MGWGVSALLLVRGIGIEVLLLTGTRHLATSVSGEQRAWTPALWNPWFIAGGLAFGLATLQAPHNCYPDVTYRGVTNGK